MNRLLVEFKKILLFGIPFILLLLVYVIMDPFMVIFKHKDYNRNYYIAKNVDYMTTEKFLANSDKITYDSFIFGSSTAMFISPEDWKKHIETDNPPYAFYASGEHFVGIWSKIMFLHEQEKKIKNALIVFDTDPDGFGKTFNDNPLFMKHYKVYPSSKLKFQYLYFLQFANVRYLRALIHYKITNKFYPYMSGYLKQDYYYRDNLTNEYHNIGILEEFKDDSIGYYSKRLNKFPKRSEKPVQKKAQLNDEYIQKLNEIYDIFIKDSTVFRIIIGPSYDQVAFNKKDVKTLENIFGSENVFDFSGINRFTDDMSNFYDYIHYKKYVGDELMDIAYSASSVK